MKYLHPRFLFRRYEIIRRLRSGKRFLEIGPGDLALAVDLLSWFEGGTLIDFNTSDVHAIFDELPENQRRRLDLVIADFSEYETVGEQFDCVVACEVLEHIEDDAAALRKMRDLLAPGGQLLLSVPASMRLWSTDDEIVGHFRRYERSELRRKLQDAGFLSAEIVCYGFPFQNLVRLVRIGLARRQYSVKGKWDLRTQSQQSAFMVKRSPVLNLASLIVNKYSLYPFSVLASVFNDLDLSDGYVATATRGAG